MRSWSPPGLVWGGTGVRGYDAPARIGLVDPGTGEIQAGVESGASERTFQRAEEPGHAGVAEDDDTPGSRWGSRAFSNWLTCRGESETRDHTCLLAVAHHPRATRPVATCAHAELQGHATTSANCGSGPGDHLGTTRPARGRTLPAYRLAAERCGGRLTCRDAYSSVLGVKGSQVQILSSRRGERGRCLARPDTALAAAIGRASDLRRTI